MRVRKEKTNKKTDKYTQEILARRTLLDDESGKVSLKSGICTDT